MNDLASRLAEDRAVRDAARAVHQTNLTQVKADLAARSIAGRIAAKARDDALDLADEVLVVAKDSKGIIAGAIAALALWFLRDRVNGLVSGLFKPAGVQESDDSPAAAHDSEEPAE